MSTAMSDSMIAMLFWLIIIGLTVLIWCLAQVVNNKIKEYFYRKDNHGESGEEGSTED